MTIHRDAGSSSDGREPTKVTIVAYFFFTNHSLVKALKTRFPGNRATLQLLAIRHFSIC